MTTLSDTPGEGLAPCPFCGGRAELIGYENRGFHRVSVACNDQCGGTSAFHSAADAIAAWNRRSPSVASDTAALPSGYEGLVAFIERVASGEFYSDYDGDLALLGKAREAIAALATPPAPQPALALIEEARPLLTLISGTKPEWEHIIDLFKRHHLAEPPWRLRDELVTILAWARYGEALDTTLASAKRFKGE